jgi:flagella basal body P-ring formation protein FlgA
MKTFALRHLKSLFNVLSLSLLALAIHFFALVCAFSSLANTNSFSETLKPQIRLLSEVDVTMKDKYTLDDVVETQGASADLLLALRSTVLELESDSSLVTIPRQKWIQIFKAADLSRYNPQYTIPESVQIRPKNGFVESEFDRKIKNKLSSFCGECKFEVNATSKTQFNSIKNQKNASWDLDLDNLQKIQSSFVVKMNTSEKPLWVPVQIKAFKSVPVASKNLLSFSKTLESEDYNMQMRDIASLSSEAMTASRLSQMTLVQSVSQGAILTESQFRKSSVVKKGQIVKVLLSEDDFQISIQASAEENGAIGDTIKIKTVGTNKLLSAQIQPDQSLVVK